MNTNTLGIAILVLCMALPAVASERTQECNIRESTRSYTMWTSDGLRIGIARSNGFINAMECGQSSSKFTAKPMLRFEEVTEVKDSPNLLKESYAGKWVKADKSPRTVQLHQSVATPLILSGWCRYETNGEAAGWMNRFLALNITGTYIDGETIPEQSAYFGQYNHGPQFNSKVLCPDKPLDRVEIKLTADDSKSTAAFKDVTLKQARYNISSPNQSCSRLDSVLSQDFTIAESDIKGTVKYQATNGYIVVRCRFTSQKKTDRAVSAYFAIPFDAVGGTWHDDVRNTRKIEAGRIYRRDDRWYGAGRDGYDDQYPLGCVENKDGVGLCIATDLSEPRVFRTEYDADRRELRIRYDIGLSPDAGRWANQGSFTAYLFTYNGNDGFRGAADKFQRIFDWAFEKHAKQEGTWIPFVTPEVIPGGSDDFHIAFVEGLSNIGWEQAHEMYSMKYVEPWIHHQSEMPEEVVRGVSGPVDPSISIKLARELPLVKDPIVAKETPDRFAGYLGSYITDNWGQPQGYFFRQQGRKENMMIVNPNPDLPATNGALFSSGGLDWDSILEVSHLSGQWHVDSWLSHRACETPIVQIDSDQKASGNQSIRLDPVPSKSPYPVWTRGIDQTFYYKGDSTGPFELSYSARGEGIPSGGAIIGWNVIIWYEDGTSERPRARLEGISSEWKRFTQVIETKHKPYAISVGFGKDSRDVDPSTIWIDDVKLVAQGSSENLLVNGDFESAQLMQGRLGGIYLDTMECYTNNLNYRREHWPYAEEPLTFDSARKPALQQQFSNVTFARRAAEWARQRGKIVFANCAPVTCFAAPYLDAMGGEEFWLSDGKFNPKADREFNFTRFMSGAKSWSILQYSDLDQKQIEHYFNRCAFYGVYASWIHNWNDPVFIAKIRPLYAKRMPILVEINTAGWRPLTLASSSNENVWLERFGDGEMIYLTVFNPTSEPQSAEITMDKRAGMTAKSGLLEMVEGEKTGLSGAESPSFNVKLGPEDLRVFKITR